jgi:nucleotide-binding universal stress UspA family protein
VLPKGADPTAGQARAENAFRHALNGREDNLVEKRIVEASTPYEGIMQEAAKCDMVIIGATKEPLFRNLLVGNVAQRVAEEVDKPVILVKQRSNVLAAMLRETVLPPIHKSPKLSK